MSRFQFTASISLVLCCLSALAQGPDLGPKDLRNLKYRNIGPSIGGRVSRVCGVPGDPMTAFAATAAGGVWKTVNGGVTWKPLTDDLPTSTFGSIAIAPSDPNVVYLGSGEANIRGNVMAGAGIFRSTDAGKTWQHVWKNIGQIGTMAVHPSNADIAFAAVLGNPFAPSDTRGVYRTTDGGKTWKRVLFKDADTGASDLSIDPSNPRIIFAGLWQTRRRPWELTSGGPGSGLYVSRDGGDTWKSLPAEQEPNADGKAEQGLPKKPWGKVCVAVAPSNGRRVYANIEAEEGGLFRSDDGGDSWQRINGHRAIRQRAWYFSTITVDPVNPNVVWLPQVPLLRSSDGGKNFERIRGPHHGDHHDIWIDPKNPQRVIDANDGGVDLSLDGGQSWTAPPLPIAQFYHIACDTSFPYRVGGSMQDIGCYAGPSRSLTATIPLSEWEYVGGGEAGHIAFDPSDPNLVYAGEYGGFISRFDRRTRQARHVGIYPYNPSGHGGESLKYRFQWTAPIHISPHDPKAIYHGANVLFRTRDGGQTWEKLSGDLTRNDKNKQKWSGGPITGDNTGVEIFCTIFAIAESPKQKGVIWVGSDDGLVHVTRDDGKTWINVTPQIPDLPDWGTVCCIEPSPFDAGTAYVVIEAHRMSDFRPHLWRTTDFGQTWTRLTAGLPPQSYLHVVRCDPKAKGILFLGNEHGIWFSRNDGANWESLRLNLPTVPVSDLIVKDDDLVLGTNGRSIWILDDITPIRLRAGTKPMVFAPLPAVRWRLGDNAAESFDRSHGPNPPYGATIRFSLPTVAKSVSLEIVDSKGQRAAFFENKPEKADDAPPDLGAYSSGDDEKAPPIPTKPGIHQLTWNLRLKGPTPIPNARVDAGDPKQGPPAFPGDYTIRLTVDGQTVTEKLVVRPDPRFPNVPQEQHEFLIKLRDDITRLSEAVKSIRLVRKQLNERAELLADEPSAKDFLAAGKSLLAKLDAIEERFHNPKAQVSYDILAMKGGARLYSQLISLYGFAAMADGLPTQGMRELSIELNGELDKLLAEWKLLLAGDVVKYNEAAKKIDVPGIWLPKAK
jgi:photosystem II stability/assembly factor-like uncharacterized protein